MKISRYVTALAFASISNVASDDISKAKELIEKAKVKRQNIIVTGPEWCGPCKQLEKYASDLKKNRGIDLYTCGNGTVIIEVRPEEYDTSHKGLYERDVRRALSITDCLEGMGEPETRMEKVYYPFIVTWRTLDGKLKPRTYVFRSGKLDDDSKPEDVLCKSQ